MRHLILLLMLGVAMADIQDVNLINTVKPGTNQVFDIVFNTSQSSPTVNVSWNATSEIRSISATCVGVDCTAQASMSVPANFLGTTISYAVRISDGQESSGTFNTMNPIVTIGTTQTARNVLASGTFKWPDGTDISAPLSLVFSGGTTINKDITGSFSENFTYPDSVTSGIYNATANLFYQNKIFSGSASFNLTGRAQAVISPSQTLFIIRSPGNITQDVNLIRIGNNPIQNATIAINFLGINYVKSCNDTCTRTFEMSVIPTAVSGTASMNISASWANDDGSPGYVSQLVPVIMDLSPKIDILSDANVINVTDPNVSFSVRIRNIGTAVSDNISLSITCPTGWTCGITPANHSALNISEEFEANATVLVSFPETVINKTVTIKAGSVEKSFLLGVSVPLIEAQGGTLVYILEDPVFDSNYYFINNDTLVQSGGLNVENITPRVKRVSQLSVWTVKLNTEKSRGIGEICDVSVLVNGSVFKIDKSGITTSLPGDVGTEVYEFLTFRGLGKCIVSLIYGDKSTEASIIGIGRPVPIYINASENTIIGLEDRATKAESDKDTMMWVVIAIVVLGVAALAVLKLKPNWGNNLALNPKMKIINLGEVKHGNTESQFEEYANE